jgi:negative regulator of flagellin synthesis FlgM
MSIEFYGIGGPNQIGNLKKSSNAEIEKSGKASGEDSVRFSSILQDVNRAQSKGAPEDTGRAERVQLIKQQIADGSYKPDLKKVSASLLQFLVEEK